MSMVETHNIGALGSLKKFSDVATATAGGTGDATTTTGETVDRFGFNGGGIAGSLVAGIFYDATLTSGETLDIAWTLQHSADASSWETLDSGSSTVATGTSTTTAFSGTLEANVDLAPANRYVRLNFAPDLSASGTDTATAQAVGFFAGFDRLPQ